jgi:MFS superfamily sulfate permease-like transporter
MISRTDLDRLKEISRQRGRLGIADLQQALPVDTMSIEELSDVLVQLEEAGIPVEIDPALLTPRHRRETLHDVKPATEPSRHRERTTTARDRLTVLASSIKAARDDSSRMPEPARPYVQKSGTIFVVAAALILILLALLAWRFI